MPPRGPKKYRCVFLYSNGSITLEVEACDGPSAVRAACEATGVREAAEVEVVDDRGMVFKTDPRSIATQPSS